MRLALCIHFQIYPWNHPRMEASLLSFCRWRLSFRNFNSRSLFQCIYLLVIVAWKQCLHQNNTRSQKKENIWPCYWSSGQCEFYVRAAPTSSYQMSVKIHSRLLNLADPVLIRLAYAQHDGRVSLWWRVYKDFWWEFFMEDGVFYPQRLTNRRKKKPTS